MPTDHPRAVRAHRRATAWQYAAYTATTVLGFALLALGLWLGLTGNQP